MIVRRVFSFSVYCLVGSLLLAAQAFAQPGQGPQPPPSNSSGSTHPGPPSGLRPGDRLNDHGVEVVIPNRGEGIAEEELYDDGTLEEVKVVTSPDGEVHVENWGSERAATDESDQTETGDASGSDNGCSDTEYDLEGYAWTGTYEWRVNPGTRPSEFNLTKEEMIETLRQATRNITQTNNNCGTPDLVTATSNYLGESSATSVLCGGGSTDGINLTKFGTIAEETVLARACTNYSWTGSASESDLLIDKDNHNWYAPFSSSSACYFLNANGLWSLEAVATHERGHTFGIGHDFELGNENGYNGEVNHKWLTMSWRINGKCQNSEATLGTGDIQGLLQLY